MTQDADNDAIYAAAFYNSDNLFTRRYSMTIPVGIRVRKGP